MNKKYITKTDILRAARLIRSNDIIHFRQDRDTFHGWVKRKIISKPIVQRPSAWLWRYESAIKIVAMFANRSCKGKFSFPPETLTPELLESAQTALTYVVKQGVDK